jgi:uncharacterized 2Fe-2S/4Fe-4S cluster protein (DUF4445 family)
MADYQVVFQPYDKSIRVPAGTNLLRAAMEAGVHINASCGGSGSCGKCRVVITEGSVEGGLSARLRDDEIAQGYRLACQSTVVGDITVTVPLESTVDASILDKRTAPRYTARVKAFDFESIKEQGFFVPPVEKVFVDLPVPTAADHEPDMTRLINALRQQHAEHRLSPDLPFMRKLPDTLRQNDFKSTVTILRPVRDGRGNRLVNIEAGDTRERLYALAVDIGTTTVFGQVVDLHSGEAVAQHGDFNGQIRFGEDVITRITLAEKPGGLDRLNRAVVETINKVIARILAQAEVDPEEIPTVTIAGNTTMTQLLLKINPRYIRHSPYVPAATLFPPIQARAIGLEINDHARALVFPQVSSYVGGDIVAGIMGSGMYRSAETTLYIDIGTNAEIVIGNKDWMVCAACSAGPAFEGGGIQFGMRAEKGAIEDFSIDPKTYEPMLLTVGNAKPRGICGSGLISTVARMFEMGVINHQGKFERDLDTPRIRETNDVWEYVLVWKDDTAIGRDIVLTEIDIENLIRAKGAIYSGCLTLLSEVGLDFDAVDQILLAGGFGAYIDLTQAITIGLLPDVDPQRIHYIGNGSLLGARISALTNQVRRDVTRVTAMMTNFELSETASFMDQYVAALFLPHTDTERFPSVHARMEAARRGA